jgi:hypothetical protein
MKLLREAVQEAYKMNQPPIKKFASGQIQATVWKNQQNFNGATKDYFTVTIERRYLQNEEWKSTNSLNANDIPKVQLVLAEAYRFIALKGENPEQTKSQAPTAQQQEQPVEEAVMG